MPDDKKKKDKRSGFDFTMYRINATQGKMVVVIHVVLLVLGWTSAFLGVPLANYWLSYAGLTLLFLTYMSVLIWALILFHERAERIEKAADAFNQEVDTLETGSLERVDIASTNPALIRLQDHINRLLDSYSRYQIVFAQTAQNAETRLNLHMGYIFPRAEFIRRVNEEIQRGQAYRSALVLVRLDHEGINVQNDLQEMLEAAKEIFPGSLRGKIDPRTYGFYLFDFDSLLSLRNRCEMLVSNFYKLEIGQVNGAERSIGCRVSACVYPYVFRTELFEKAEAALDNSEEPIVIDSGSGAIYFPRVIMTEDVKRCAFQSILETFESRFRQAETREEAVQVLREMVAWTAKGFGCSSGGVLRYDSAGGRYSVFFEEGESAIFGRDERRLNAEDIDPFYEACFQDPYFIVNDVSYLPRNLFSFCQNLDIKSLFLKALTSMGKKQGLVFLAAKKNTDLSSMVAHDTLQSFAHLASEMMNALEIEQTTRGHARLVDALGNRTHRYLYSIDRATYRLAFVSGNLQRLFPEAKTGELCYKVFRTDHDKPCSHCPLLHGPEERIIPRISSQPSTVSTLENRGAGNDVATIVIEPMTQENIGSATNKLVDETTGIHNQRALTLSLNRDVKNNVLGYVLAIKIIELNEFAASFPNMTGDAVLSMIVRNLQDAGYEDILYRYDADTICLYLSNYTKTRAITLVEEVSEILSMPITVMAASGVPQASYALAGYPSEVASFREFQTALATSFEEARKLGPGYLMLQGRQKPRRALRSEYITNVLKNAIEDARISVLLQPIVSGKTWKADAGDIRAALTTPEGTPVAPAEFIPLAEKAKLVSKVDMSSLQNLGDLYSGPGSSTLRGGGINHLDMYLSAATIYDPEFPKAVIQAFETYRFPKDYLTFEIRTVFLEEHPKEVMALQEALRGKSVTFSATEFDFERNSLETLKKLGIHHLKTAVRSVKTALSNQRDMNAFSRFVNTAIIAGFSITATGIETEEEAKFASSFDIPFLEGYFFGRPMNTEDFLNAITYGSKTRE